MKLLIWEFLFNFFQGLWPSGLGSTTYRFKTISLTRQLGHFCVNFGKNNHSCLNGIYYFWADNWSIYGRGAYAPRREYLRIRINSENASNNVTHWLYWGMDWCNTCVIFLCKCLYNIHTCQYWLNWMNWNWPVLVIIETAKHDVFEWWLAETRSPIIWKIYPKFCLLYSQKKQDWQNF